MTFPGKKRSNRSLLYNFYTFFFLPNRNLQRRQPTAKTKNHHTRVVMFPEYRARKDKAEGKEEMLGLQVDLISSNSIPYMPGQISFIHCKPFRRIWGALTSMAKNVFSLAILAFSLSISLHECLILISLPFLAAAYYCMLISSLQASGEMPVR